MGDGMDGEGDELGNPELEVSEGEDDNVIIAKGKNLTKTHGLGISRSLGPRLHRDRKGVQS